MQESKEKKEQELCDLMKDGVLGWNPGNSNSSGAAMNGLRVLSVEDVHHYSVDEAVASNW